MSGNQDIADFLELTRPNCAFHGLQTGRRKPDGCDVSRGPPVLFWLWSGVSLRIVREKPWGSAQHVNEKQKKAKEKLT